MLVVADIYYLGEYITLETGNEDNVRTGNQSWDRSKLTQEKPDSTSMWI